MNHHKHDKATKSPVEKLNIHLPSPIQTLPAKVFDDVSGIELLIKRDDLIHPVISGNKWRKLQQVFEGTFADGHGDHVEKIVSFGGGFSNHLHAVGCACYQLNIPFTAMVRGNYADNLTPMLKDLKTWNADIQWLTKIQYQQKTDHDWLKQTLHDYEKHLVIPEGGSSRQVHFGMQQLVDELPEELDYLLCPVGSGGTLAGLIQAMYQRQRKTKVIGIGVLKGQGYLEDLVTELVTEKDALTHQPWHIFHDYHFGGYGKADETLRNYCQHFFEKSNIEIEPVYSGKLMFAIQDLLSKGYFAANSTVCALHTGGLQGNR